MMHNQLDTLPTTLLESWTPPQPGRLAELAIKSIRYVSVRRIRASAAELALHSCSRTCRQPTRGAPRTGRRASVGGRTVEVSDGLN